VILNDHRLSHDAVGVAAGDAAAMNSCTAAAAAAAAAGGQVSPHEFMQAVMAASKRRFIIEAQSDPVEFWSWLLNSLHMDLTCNVIFSVITLLFWMLFWVVIR
jgi:ubiquitin C-terminal hydrolase